MNTRNVLSKYFCLLRTSFSTQEIVSCLLNFIGRAQEHWQILESLKFHELPESYQFPSSFQDRMFSFGGNRGTERNNSVGNALGVLLIEILGWKRALLKCWREPTILGLFWERQVDKTGCGECWWVKWVINLEKDGQLCYIWSLLDDGTF